MIEMLKYLSVLEIKAFIIAPVQSRVCFYTQHARCFSLIRREKVYALGDTQCEYKDGILLLGFHSEL